jgi:hypothetical protein
VIAWRTAGRAGRDSFQSTDCWIFDDLGVNNLRFAGDA